MLRSCGCSTAQSFEESAQKLYMCTPKLENTCIFTILTCFIGICFTFYVTFLFSIFGAFLADPDLIFEVKCVKLCVNTNLGVCFDLYAADFFKGPLSIF